MSARNGAPVGIRLVLIQGEGLSQVRDPLLTLLRFLAVLLPFSLWAFGRAVRARNAKAA